MKSKKDTQKAGLKDLSAGYGNRVLHSSASSSSSLSSSMSVLVSSPLYKHVISLQEHFRDSVERVWWNSEDRLQSLLVDDGADVIQQQQKQQQRHQQNTYSNGQGSSGQKCLKRQPYTLKQLGAFAVAKVLVQNDSYSDDEWYDSIPSHYSR
jgi:hypothetical protein